METLKLKLCVTVLCDGLTIHGLIVNTNLFTVPVLLK